jgi:hypothetical protein
VASQPYRRFQIDENGNGKANGGGRFTDGTVTVTWVLRKQPLSIREVNSISLTRSFIHPGAVRNAPTPIDALHPFPPSPLVPCVRACRIGTAPAVLSCLVRTSINLAVYRGRGRAGGEGCYGTRKYAHIVW